MIATRIIPILLWKDSSQVISKRFNPWRVVGSMDQAVRVYERRQVDELIILDLGSKPYRADDIIRYSSILFSPLAIGGGIKTLEDIRTVLASGADKVVLKGDYNLDLDFLRTAARKFGSQAIAISLNVSRDHKQWIDSELAGDFAKTFADNGAGEILLQSVDRDGTMEGYDIELIREVSHWVDVPVVAAGGCQSYDDMAQAIKAGAHAVAASALFQFTDATPKEAAEHLKANGFNTRA
jgi:imidazole glycerol-phosphate synthase subunit HisF